MVETVVVGADQWEGGFERQYVVMLWEPMRMLLEDAQR